jgi:predicted RNA binding protein YcfA (HicA-like mRNA interferase family)
MKHYTRVPAINGKQLIRLLENDGWKMRTERATHGVAFTKTFRDRTRVTIIPDTSASLDDGTLAAILGTKQTCIGKVGLLELINKYGI